MAADTDTRNLIGQASLHVFLQAVPLYDMLTHEACIDQCVPAALDVVRSNSRNKPAVHKSASSTGKLLLRTSLRAGQNPFRVAIEGLPKLLDLPAGRCRPHAYNT